MCRVDIDRGQGFRVDPTVENSAAGIHERVGNIPLDHVEFEVGSKWRGGDGLPHTGTTPNILFVITPQNLAGCGIHEVNLQAGNASQGLKNLLARRNLLGEPSLHIVTGVGAAV
jgi:hypothetical protein